jgi:hypothetical protein
MLGAIRRLRGESGKRSGIVALVKRREKRGEGGGVDVVDDVGEEGN